MTKFTAFLKLIRWPNLLFMAAILLVLRYGFLIPLEFSLVLSPIWHLVFILSTVLLAAGGNAINDVYDVNADAINKPEKRIIGKSITLDEGQFFGQGLLLLGAIIGLVLGYFNNMFSFSYIFPLSGLLLWFYAKDLKRRTLIGNLIIALLAGLLVFNEAIFDLLLTLKTEDRDMQMAGIYVIIAVSSFSFSLTLVREIIKDLQDVEGDRQAGYKTLAITSGTSFPKILSILLLMIITVAISWVFWQSFASRDLISAGYILACIILPLVYTILRIAPANSPVKFGKISTLLKIIMISGLLSVLIFTLSFKMGWNGAL